MLKISNKALFFYVAVVMVVSMFLLVQAYSYSSQIPNPGHGGDEIWVDVDESSPEGEKTLQEALGEDIAKISYVDQQISEIGNYIDQEISNVDQRVNQVENDFSDIPRCTGDNKALQWDGSSFSCETIESGSSGGSGGGDGSLCGLYFGLKNKNSAKYGSEGYYTRGEIYTGKIWGCHGHNPGISCPSGFERRCWRHGGKYATDDICSCFTDGSSDTSEVESSNLDIGYCRVAGGIWNIQEGAPGMLASPRISIDNLGAQWMVHTRHNVVNLETLVVDDNLIADSAYDGINSYNDVSPTSDYGLCRAVPPAKCEIETNGDFKYYDRHPQVLDSHTYNASQGYRCGCEEGYQIYRTSRFSHYDIPNIYSNPYLDNGYYICLPE